MQGLQSIGFTQKYYLPVVACKIDIEINFLELFMVTSVKSKV